MAKENGLGLTVTVDDSGGTGRAISADVGDATFDIPSNVLDWTGVNATGFERGYGLADMTVTFNGTFDDAADLAHAVFKNYRTILAGQVGRTTAIAHSGQTLSDEILYSNFSYNRATDGSLRWSAPGNLSDGGTPAWS